MNWSHAVIIPERLQHCIHKTSIPQISETNNPFFLFSLAQSSSDHAIALSFTIATMVFYAATISRMGPENFQAPCYPLLSFK